MLGNKSRIKAYTVAVDALGKPDTFDPQNDPVVRVLAGRLRSSLSGYYENHPNTNVVYTNEAWLIRACLYKPTKIQLCK